MNSRQFTQYILGLVIIFSSSFALSNTQFTYNVIDGGIEITGCVDECPSDLVIPEEIDGYNVTRIDYEAFFRLPSFWLLKLSDTITSIGRGAFFETGLPLIRLPKSLKHIEEAAFFMSLAYSSNPIYQPKIIFPENIETIGYASFAANNLSELHFLGNRPVIDADAFGGNDIQTVSYCSGAIGWPGNPINGITPVENTSCANNTEFDYTIEYPYASIDGCTFFCIDDLIIPETIDGYEVKKIGVNGFENSILNSITIPKSIEEIGESAFHGSTASTLNFLGDRPLINGEGYIGEMIYLDMVTYCPNTEGWPGYAINGITPEMSEDCDNSNDQQDSPQYATFDIDKNGSVGALSDGLILLRYFFGLRGEGLIANVLAEDATRTSAADIEAYIESHMP